MTPDDPSNHVAPGGDFYVQYTYYRQREGDVTFVTHSSGEEQVHLVTLAWPIPVPRSWTDW